MHVQARWATLRAPAPPGEAYAMGTIFAVDMSLI